MGAVTVGFVRLLLSALAMLVSLVSGVVVARKLPRLDYGVYYVAARRTLYTVRLLYLPLGYWQRRHADRRRMAEYLGAALAALPAYYALSAALILAAGAPLHLALIYAVYSALGGFALALIDTYTGYRYLRSSLLRLAYRAVLATLIVILVYAARMGSHGIVAAQTLAATLVTYIVAREVGLAKPRRDLLRPEAIRVPLLNVAAGIVSNMVFILASALATPQAMAVYGVSILIPMMATELLDQASAYTVPYIVKTGDVRGILRLYKILVLAAAPLLGFIAAHPLITVSLLNPSYATLATIYVPLAALLAAPLRITSTFATRYSAAYGRETRESSRLLNYALASLGQQLGLLAATPLVLSLVCSRDPVLGVYAIIATNYALGAILASIYAPGVERVAAYGLAGVAVSAATALYTGAVYPDRIYPRFYEAAAAAIEGALYTIPVYVALLLDPDVRLVVVHGVRKAPRLIAELLKKGVGGFTGQPSA